MTGRRAIVLGGLAMPLGFSRPYLAFAQSTSTWDQILKSGKIRIGLIPNRVPYQWVENGQVRGFIDIMARAFVGELSQKMGHPIEIEYVQTTNQTTILDLQSGRMDVYIPLTVTKARQAAVDMFEPFYLMPVVAFNRRGFEPGTMWDDYNKPSTRIVAVMGTTDELTARKRLPLASIRAMRSTSEAVLEVQSGKSDALVMGLLLGLVGMKANANLGTITMLQPLDAPPSGGGTRKDGDGRFARFMQDWATAYQKAGGATAAIMAAMKEGGLDVGKIPAGVTF